MYESGGAPANADDGGDGHREGRMSEEDGHGSESMCRQRGSMGRMTWSRGGEPSQALGLCLTSERVSNPSVHSGSRGRNGSDNAGSNVMGGGEEERRRTTGKGWREGGVWPASGSL